MTTMTRFVPIRFTFSEIAVLQSRLNSMFNEFARPELEASAMGSFVPAVDVYEDTQALVLKLEIPAVKLDNLDARLENRTLTVKGERRLEGDVKQESFHRIERRFGSFVRNFTLPETVDTEALTASYDAGVLTIAVAKKAEAKPRQIKIEVVSPDLAAAGSAKAVEAERIA